MQTYVIVYVIDRKVQPRGYNIFNQFFDVRQRFAFDRPISNT